MYYGNGNMVLICHVISQDHLIKGSCNFMRSPSRWTRILPSLVTMATLMVELRFDFVTWSYKTKWSIKGSCDFLGGNPLVSHHPTKLGSHKHCGSGDMFLVVKEQDFTCPCFNPPLLFIFKARGIPCSNTWNFRI